MAAKDTTQSEQMVVADDRDESSSPSARVRAFDIATIVDRLDTVERWLAEGMTPRQAQARAAKTWGQDRRTSTRFVAAALERLSRDTNGEPLESKRARSIAFWHAQIQRALNAERTFVQNGETITYTCPDFKAANQARAALDAIEGVATLKP